MFHGFKEIILSLMVSYGTPLDPITTTTSSSCNHVPGTVLQSIQRKNPVWVLFEVPQVLYELLLPRVFKERSHRKEEHNNIESSSCFWGGNTVMICDVFACSHFLMLFLSKLCNTSNQYARNRRDKERTPRQLSEVAKYQFRALYSTLSILSLEYVL